MNSKFLLKGIGSVKRQIEMPHFPGLLFEQNFPKQSLKFASLQYALDHTTEYVRAVIQCCPIEGNHKYIVVDVKVHDLEPGIVPALPKWHFDCVGDPRDSRKEERHHLFITEGSSTEFLANDEEIELPEKFTHSVFKNANFVGQKIEPYYVYTYGRHLHRATPATQKIRRLLVRVSETDIVRPTNQKFQVTYAKAT